jgi:hypothetical protein
LKEKEGKKRATKNEINMVGKKINRGEENLFL